MAFYCIETNLAVVSPSSSSGPYLSMYFSQVLMCALMSLRQTRVLHSAQFWYSDFILLAMSVVGTPSEGRYARQYGHVHLLLFFILVAMQDRQNLLKRNRECTHQEIGLST